MTSIPYNRREFLGRTIASGTGTALAMTSLSWAADQPASRTGKAAKLSTPKAEKLGWRICCQIYTFRDRSFYEALGVVADIGVRRVEPAFFLPLSKEQPDLKTSESLAPDKRREMKQRMNDLGISMSAEPRRGLMPRWPVYAERCPRQRRRASPSISAPPRGVKRSFAGFRARTFW